MADARQPTCAPNIADSAKFARSERGKARAIAVAGGHRGIRNLHSLPGHYGLLTAMWCAIPALVVFVAWVALQDTIVTRLVLSHLGAAQQGMPEAQLSLMLNDLRNVVAGSLPAASVAVTGIVVFAAPDVQTRF